MIRVGKLGIVRVTGKDMEALRDESLVRDGGRCVRCGRRVTDYVPDYAPIKYDMAHKVSRSAGGSDTIDNVETMCHECHLKSHNAGGKPLPRKPH
jgi:5-methylcytosine-specific restriction endonuclease McrA